MVDRRWAMTSTVRPFTSRWIACGGAPVIHQQISYQERRCKSTSQSRDSQSLSELHVLASTHKTKDSHPCRSVLHQQSPAHAQAHARTRACALRMLYQCPHQRLHQRLHHTCCTSASLTLSRALVASSRMMMGESFSSARARATRCRCPPDSSTPRSPTTVLYPSGSSCAWPHT